VNMKCRVCHECEFSHFDATDKPRCIYGGPYAGYVTVPPSSNGRTADFESANPGSNPGGGLPE
jgi:hypothetical protein